MKEQHIMVSATANLDAYLSDEEVVKAILKIMIKSKVWQAHLQEHKGAQLQLLASPGFQVKSGERSISAVIASSPVTTLLPASASQSGRRYGMYSGLSVQHTVAVHQGVNVVYGNSTSNPSSSSAQQVIAGCNCGLVFDMKTGGANAHTPSTTVTQLNVNYSLMQNSYVNQNAESAGYGSSANKGAESKYSTGF